MVIYVSKDYTGKMIKGTGYPIDDGPIIVAKMVAIKDYALSHSNGEYQDHGKK